MVERKQSHSQHSKNSSQTSGSMGPTPSLCTSMGTLWRGFTISNSWETSSRTGSHGLTTSRWWLKKARQRPHFLRLLKKNNLSEEVLVLFYRTTTESILMYCVTVCYAGRSAAGRRSVQRDSTEDRWRTLAKQDCSQKPPKGLLSPPQGEATDV